MGPDSSPSRPWSRLLTAAAVLALALVVLVSLVGWSTLPTTASSTAEEQADVEALAGQVGALHEVPVLMPGGLVESRFADAAALEDEAYVRAGLAFLADEIGAGAAMPGVFAALDDLQTNPPESHPYPFSYPALEAAAQPLVDRTAVATDRDVLHEMAALAMLAASRHGGRVDQPGGYDGALAHVLLRALAGDPSDCAAHLDLAVLTSLGQFPTGESVDQTFGAAVAACPDDPTPRWWWVQVQASWAQSIDSLEYTGVDRPEAMARPLRTARAWQDDQPGSALAWASEAEALVLQAERLRAQGVMPFTVRARARSALESFTVADRLEHDPAFTVGRARALSALGRHEEATVVMAEAVAEAPRNADFHALHVTLLQRAHRWEDAAEQAAVPLDSFDQPRVLDVVPDLIAAPAGLVGLGHAEGTPALVADPTIVGRGAGGVDWLGFIPDYRVHGVAASTSPWCRHRAELRNLVLAGRAGDALDVPEGDPEHCDVARDSSWDPSVPSSFEDLDARLLRAMAHDLDGDTAARDALLDSELGAVPLPAYYDEVQNLWRYAGELEQAEEVLRRWLDEVPGPVAHARLGEVLFLTGRYDDAADEFAAALASPATDEETGNPLDWSETVAAQTRLEHGTALERDGRTEDAAEIYRELAAVDEVPDEEFGPNKPFRLSIAGARARLGLLALTREDEEGAADWLRPAAQGVREQEDPSHRPFDPVLDSWTAGAEANNLAVAILAQGDVSDAEAEEAALWAERAAGHDPVSPIYLDTLALARQQGGDSEGSVSSYRAALREDPTLYQSWNNLGVLLDEQGDRDGAAGAFRSAVEAKSDYALGWFNLGVVLGRGASPADFVDSQRALARAVRLEPSYRGRSETVEKDSSVVLTGLDVSRPIPADWTFVDTASEAAPGLSLVVLLLAVWRLLLALGLDQVGGWVGGKVLSERTHARWGSAWGAVNRFTALAWAVLASLLVVSWPIARGSGGQWWQIAAVALAVIGVLWLYVVVERWRALRHLGGQDQRPVHRGWAPGMAFGVVSTLVGYAFVPVPVNAQRETDRRVRHAGLVLLAVVAATMLAIGFVTGAPVARLVGIGVLAMLSTALFPLKPYDGGYLQSRGAAAASSLALVAVSSALVLGWL